MEVRREEDRAQEAEKIFLGRQVCSNTGQFFWIFLSVYKSSCIPKADTEDEDDIGRAIALSMTCHDPQPMTGDSF
jgi:hypothetical protein